MTKPRRRPYDPVVHDRQALSLPAHARIAPLEVDDPYSRAGETERIVVARSIARDPLAWLHAHRQIDDAKYHAGRKWQMLYERAAIGAVQSVDTTKEPVDGGRWPDLLTDSRAAASAELGRLTVLLDRDGGNAGLVYDVLGRGLSTAQAAEQRGDASEYAVKLLGRRLQAALDLLAVELGFVARPRSGAIAVPAGEF